MKLDSCLKLQGTLTLVSHGPLQVHDDSLPQHPDIKKASTGWIGEGGPAAHPRLSVVFCRNKFPSSRTTSSPMTSYQGRKPSCNRWPAQARSSFTLLVGICMHMPCSAPFRQLLTVFAVRCSLQQQACLRTIQITRPAAVKQTLPLTHEAAQHQEPQAYCSDAPLWYSCCSLKLLFRLALLAPCWDGGWHVSQIGRKSSPSLHWRSELAGNPASSWFRTVWFCWHTSNSFLFF